MSKVIYTAEAHVDSGRADGHGRTSDGALDVQLRRPADSGVDKGTNPEQLFAVGYAACFASALGGAARRAKVVTGQVSIDSHVSLVAAEDGRYRLQVALDVHLPEVADPADAVDLVKQADQVCPYSNAIRGNVDVAFTANGKPVA